MEPFEEVPEEFVVKVSETLTGLMGDGWRDWSDEAVGAVGIVLWLLAQAKLDRDEARR